MSDVESLDGNRLVLLRNGADFFPALRRAIDAAQKLVHIETYIFAEDESGQMIANALMDAARRGVVTRVIIDGFGCKRFLFELRERLMHVGVEVLLYRPDITPWDFRRSRLRRLHRKIAVVDGRIGFVGGINIIDDMHTPNQTPPRHDYAVQIEGPLLGPLLEEANLLWRIVAWANFRQQWMYRDDVPVDTAPKGTQRAALVVRDNLRHRSDIEDAYLEAINGAREEIILACPYFFPGSGFRHALMDASARGVRVVVLLQARVEYALMHYASRALYGALLENGVEIFEYNRSFLHAKVAVIDGRWATVGSSNIDPFSLLLAREANVVVEDTSFAQELRVSLLELMQRGAMPVAREKWRYKPLGLRIRIWIAYGVSRFLIGWFGYAGWHRD
ncbi:MAG TPA: cardiolipin synthase ClsB [Burkholderiales bacterium]|nr:cardiolipin synthase ClsB [Burkholderiales bacterium]